MKRGSSTLMIFSLLGLLILLGVYCAWSKRSNEKYEDTTNDIEMIPQTEEINDQFDLVGVAPEEPAFEIGFGMGPGLYGSGRQLSEFVGN